MEDLDPLQLLRSLQVDEDEDQRANGNGTVAVLIICLALFCFIWAPQTCRRCRHRHQRSRDRRLANSDALAREATMIQNSLRAMMEQDARHFRGMTMEDRREYINNVLMVKKAILNTEPASTDATLKRSKSHLLITAASDDKDENESDDGREQCTICLTDYEDGDEICWSHNKHCNHVFHRKCITEWLLSHEECPCCRHPYLAFDDDQLPNVPPVAALSSSGDDDNSQLVRGLQLFYHLAVFPPGRTGSFGDFELSLTRPSRERPDPAVDRNDESDDNDTTGYDQITSDGRAIHISGTDVESGMLAMDDLNDDAVDSEDAGRPRSPPISVAMASPEDNGASQMIEDSPVDSPTVETDTVEEVGPVPVEQGSVGSGS